MKKNLFILLASTLVLVSCSQPLVVDVESQIKPIYECIYRGPKFDYFDENNIQYIVRQNRIIDFKHIYNSNSFELYFDGPTGYFEFKYNGRPYNYYEIKKFEEFFNDLRKATSTVIQFNTEEECVNFNNFMHDYTQRYFRGCFEFTYTEEEILHIEETYFKPIIKAFKEYVNKNCSTK